MNHIPINIIYQEILLTGYAEPVDSPASLFPSCLKICIQGWYIGKLSYCDNKWSMDQPIDPHFVELLGRYLYSQLDTLTTRMNYRY